MNCDLFNMKLNLPKLCEKLGYTDYEYLRLPTFGWFAYTKDKSFIGNAFDVVSPKERESLYAAICLRNPELLDFETSYSEVIDAKIKASLFETQLWSSAYAYAKKEFETHRVVYAGKRVLLKELLKENGYNGVMLNEFGVITASVIEKYRILRWPKSAKGHLMIPSYCTPKHICSLEHCPWDQPGQLHSLWLNSERGWYGDISSNNIVSSLKELWVTGGFTWDPKADFWATGYQVSLAPTLSVPDLLKLWSTTKNTVFELNPLLKITEQGNADELKNYIADLSFDQIQEIEGLTKLKLSDAWRKSREQQVQIGNKMFIKRDNCYWVFKKGKLEQITNFAIEVEKIVKRGNEFFRKGNLLFGKQVVPFEMSEKFFTTNHLFHRGIKEKFLSAGLGIPIVHTDFFYKALMLVDSFNSATPVELELDQC